MNRAPDNKKLLILDPFLGPSHMVFWEAIKKHSSFAVDIYPYKSGSWKLSSGLSSFTRLKNKDYDAYLVSDFFDISSFKSLNPDLADKPFIHYLHENQFEYPVRNLDKRDEQFSLINLKNYLSADINVFNSNWNRDSFLEGVKRFRRRLPSSHRSLFPEMDSLIRNNDKIVYPSPDLEKLPEKNYFSPNSSPLKVIWNHRWEHDKGPGKLTALASFISENDLDVVLDVCGESHKSSDLNRALSETLGNRLTNCSYYERKEDYLRALSCADVVLSTADHEFYGISVLEGLATGLYPILPNKLSYPELYKDLYSKDCFYENTDDLCKKIEQLAKLKSNDPKQFSELTNHKTTAQLIKERHSQVNSVVKMEKIITSLLK